MHQLTLILSITIGSIAFGYVLQRVLGTNSIERLREISTYMKLTAFFALNPIAVVNSFWKISIESTNVLVFPALGMLSLLVGGGSAIIFIRVFKIPPHRAASVFVAGMFSNVLTFGGFIAFVLYGYPGYALVQLFTMLVSATYYMIGFPLSDSISKGRLSFMGIGRSALKDNPILIVPLIAITSGILLRVTGVPRPYPLDVILDTVVSYLIPTITALLGVSIGITLRFARIGDYRQEIAIVIAIKFLITPLVMIPLGFLLGLHTVMDGIPIRVIAILSLMPVAFNALVPPSLYGFDLDLANSAWIVTTIGLVVIVPFMFLFLTFA